MKRFPDLASYFTAVQAAALKKGLPGDTMKAMAKRHLTSPQTIWRARAGRPISYGLALELAEGYGIKFESFNVQRRKPRA